MPRETAVCGRPERSEGSRYCELLRCAQDGARRAPLRHGSRCSPAQDDMRFLCSYYWDTTLVGCSNHVLLLERRQFVCSQSEQFAVNVVIILAQLRRGPAGESTHVSRRTRQFCREPFYRPCADLTV